jgi:ribosomal protein L40E
VGKTIRRLKNKTGNFTIVLNEVFRRSDLSAKAKGLYAYLMTLPDDWIIRKQELYNHFLEGKAALDTGFKELETAGYINKRLLRDGHGYITAPEYTVYESAEMNGSPKSENRKPVKQKAGSPKSDYPISDNRPLLKTDSTKDLVELNTENNKFIKNGSSSNGAGLKKKQLTTTTIISNFQKECERLGFSITEAKARSILKTGLDPAWFTGPGSFPAYIAAYVDNAYSDKAPDERLKLFLSALTWEDKQEEYRGFLKEQEIQAGENRQKAETEAEQQRKAAMRKSAPLSTVCGNCGAALPSGSITCQKCNYFATWDNKQEKYIFVKGVDFSELVKGVKKKHRIANDNAGEDDIDKYFREA